MGRIAAILALLALSAAAFQPLPGLHPQGGQIDTNIMRKIVLVGGGHAHVQVIKSLNRVSRPSDVHVTLIDRQRQASYSGMVPGCVSNLYSLDQVQIDVAPLAEWAGDEFICGTVIGMTYDNEDCDKYVTVEVTDGNAVINKQVPFDVISFDIGSTTRGFSSVPGARKHAISTRPISELVLRIQREEEKIKSAGLKEGRVVVVGGGAAGIELALGLRARWNDLLNGKLSITLCDSGDELMPAESKACRDALNRVMLTYRIDVIHNASVEKVGQTTVNIQTSEKIGVKNQIVLEYTHCIWATGAERHQLAEDLNSQCGLEVTDRGWIVVNEYLESISHPGVFAAGDCNEIKLNGAKSPPKAGVYAVRSGPVLIENITRKLSGKKLTSFEPQSDFLKLLMCGDGKALGFRFGIPLFGKWVWELKDHIDVTFMNLFDVNLLPKLEIGGERGSETETGGKKSYDTKQYDAYEAGEKRPSASSAAADLLRTDDDVDYLHNWNIIKEMVQDGDYRRDVLAEARMKLA